MTAALFCQTEGLGLPGSVSTGWVSPGRAIARLHQLPVGCGLSGHRAAPTPLPLAQPLQVGQGQCCGLRGGQEVMLG